MDETVFVLNWIKAAFISSDFQTAKIKQEEQYAKQQGREIEAIEEKVK